MVMGGVHGCGGHVWLQGACMVAWGIVAAGGAWLWGGMHGCGGVCMVAGGMHGCRGACMVVGGGMHGSGGVHGGGGGREWDTTRYGQ